ncbi:unnamed protein product [Camellia sinensis]
MATASWSSSTLVQSQITGFSGGLRQSRSHPKFSHLYKLSVMSMELGCDARGYSRVGNETAIWYCVILAGRSTRTQQNACSEIQEALSTVDKDQPSSPAVVALKEKRLIFTSLDGEAQQVSPFFCQGYQKT